jgi:hypothetical protein
MGLVLFSYEWSTTLSEEEYVRRESAHALRRSLSAKIVTALLILSGIACLFRASTLPLALVLLVAGGIMLTLQLWLKAGFRRMYRRATYLHGPITHGVNDRGPLFKEGDLSAQTSWDDVQVWAEEEEKLWIAASGMPAVYLSIAELKECEIYERVLGLAKEKGAEFDSAKARSRGAASSTL